MFGGSFDQIIFSGVLTACFYAVLIYGRSDLKNRKLKLWNSIEQRGVSPVEIVDPHGEFDSSDFNSDK